MKKKIKMLVDLLMLIALPMQIVCGRIGTALHEWLGIAVFLLFLLHHGLNWRWYKNLFGGRYSAVRLGSLLVNVLLFVLMFAVPVSGLARAEHVSFLHMIHVSDAGQLHLVTAYGICVLIAIHVGMHGAVMHGAGD